MRRLSCATAFIAIVLLGSAGAAPASPPTSAHSGFEGRIAAATWVACGPAGCFATTVTLHVGAVERDGVQAPIRQMTVSRTPDPLPADHWQVIIASIQQATVAIAEDLSSAGGSGQAQIIGEDCAPGGCFGGSAMPLGFASFDASWTATATAGHVHRSSRRSFTSMFGEDCVEMTKQSGTQRAADATLDISNVADADGWAWELGTLTSASISQVRSVSTTRCRTAA
jgi:hypothetical protein